MFQSKNVSKSRNNSFQIPIKKCKKSLPAAPSSGWLTLCCVLGFSVSLSAQSLSTPRSRLTSDSDSSGWRTELGGSVRTSSLTATRTKRIIKNWLRTRCLTSGWYQLFWLVSGPVTTYRPAPVWVSVSDIWVITLIILSSLTVSIIIIYTIVIIRRKLIWRISHSSIDSVSSWLW